ncbi:TIGR03619 family F420-dependent LLM class oxidoreductase [Kribbella italica]|uniref:Putative F420-dependent oxidoreductase n=1 Tax=Kribbella italica TaxID=1540520 RepID=A0A7W9MZT7_9ACTN|nr:putative F420-dependent oxidoreductase [Kribbella italica]
MKHAVVSFLSDYGIQPVALGRAVEERGFDALFLTEHTHIPLSRRTPYPAGGELPEHYKRTYDPLIALTAIAGATTTLQLGTGIALINQHHPLVLAKQTASLDRLSSGRFELGVGPGWNVEEMANHGVDSGRRTLRMLEHIEAIRAVWTNDEAQFHGKFVDFGPVWSWPKPEHAPPVLIAGYGPSVLDRVLSHGDGWLPIGVGASDVDEFAVRIADLRSRAADLGRPRPSVTLYGAEQTPEVLRAYADAGVDRVLFELVNHGQIGGSREEDRALDELDRLAALRA